MNESEPMAEPLSSVRLRQLADMSRLFTEVALDLETLLDTIVRQVSLVLSDGCAIRTLSDSEDGELLVPSASYHPDPLAWQFMRDMLAASPQHIGEGLNGQVAASGQAIFLPHIPIEQSRRLVKPEYMSYVERFGVHSTIVVPLRSRGELIGTVTVIRDITPAPYQEQDVVFLQDLADRAAMAIENARLYARVSSSKDMLERRVAERTAALTDSNERLRHELTTRRRLEAMLEQLNRRQRLILDSLGEGVIVIGRDGRLTFANPAALTMLGWNEEDLLGKRKHDVLHHSRPDGSLYPRSECAMCAAIDQGNVYRSTDEIFWTRSGQFFPVSVIMTPLIDGADRLGAVIAFNDISQEQRIEQALREAKAVAEQANQAKSEFLSRMSHELRTPLNAILGFAQVLQMDALNPDQQESLRHILTGGRHLLNLINEVLDFSRIESGNLALSPEPIMLRQAVIEAVDTMRVLAANRSILIRTDIESFANHQIIADRQRLKQVLYNIISNAIKYNKEHGRIRVSGQLTSDATLRIVIADTGIGIDAQHADSLFKPFERLGAQASLIEGTGLGLSLSKHLMEAMHGQIDYSSVPGQGSTFWIEFPLSLDATIAQSVNPAPSSPLVEARSTMTHVLLIEDNLSNLRLIERLLSPALGFRITAAMQGQIGLDLAVQHRPDLILLDLHLPDLHGEDVLQRLRSEPLTSTIPVIVITADATARQSERLQARGANSYLSKPLDVPVFLQTVNAILGL